MEVLWNIDRGIMEKLRNLCGSFMDKILDWNMEKLLNICGKSARWKVTDWKNQRRAKMERYAKPNGRVEHATENCRLGKH